MRKIVNNTGVSVKDDNGQYLPSHLTESEEPTLKDPESIDDLLKMGLRNIYGILRVITVEVGGQTFDRNTVQNLRDCMVMLSDLKKKEQEFIDGLTDEELEKLTKK